jgi:hypothetical protein
VSEYRLRESVTIAGMKGLAQAGMPETLANLEAEAETS